MTKVYEDDEARNRGRVFKDRFHAGRVLGRMLAPVYGGAENVMVLGIPMGGVPVALTIAGALRCPVDLVIVRKLQIPGNTEAGFGAMTPAGDVFLNEPLLDRLGLSGEEIARQRETVRAELTKRDRGLRDGRPLPDLGGRTVILVDDGLASGFTMKAALATVRRQGAATTVVAVPTAPRRAVDALEGSVDEVYCANIRDATYFAVAEAYENWYDLTEAAVKKLLAASTGRVE